MVANNLEDTPRGFSRETFDANVSNQLLADYYYPAFRASIVAADAKGVMCALNAVRGKPACLSPLLKAARINGLRMQRCIQTQGLLDLLPCGNAGQGGSPEIFFPSAPK